MKKQSKTPKDKTKASAKPAGKSPTRKTGLPPATATKKSAAVVKTVPAVETPVVADAVVTAAATVPAESSPVIAAVPEQAPTIDLRPMITELRSETAETAIEAIEALGATRDERAVAPLLEVLRNEDGYFHVVTRAAAAMALGKLGRASAADGLLVAIHDSQAEVSTESILALGELRAAGAVPQLIEIVQNYNNYYLDVTRHAAIRALARLGDASARPALTNISHSDWEDAAITNAARDALSQI
ncbi:MAG: HEAT repeat domain-containing protein [Burkholderiales bacterium]|nr:HEAT repeat domain-containing protein [Phycisphaerae bacterium]